MANPLTTIVTPLRKRVGRIRKRVRAFVARHGSPLEASAVEAVLHELMPDPPRVLMMHSSLSACGYIKGGAETVIRSVASSAQTLAMPTHTYCYPSAGGGEPPVFDPSVTPSRVGRITDAFWRQPGTLRSIHSTHSLAARGPDAEEIVRDHQACDTPCGRGTPYERLIQMDAAALMFGVTMHSYTFFHTAEDAAEAPYAYDEADCNLRFIDGEGNVRTTRSRKQSQDERIFRQMDRPLEEAGLLRRQRLGRGELLFIPSTAAVHEFLLQRFAEDPYYLAANKGQQSIRKRTGRTSVR